jgi:hypothetical protein
MAREARPGERAVVLLALTLSGLALALLLILPLLH